MATTTNYSWSTPDDTALVKDGAAAIRSLGTAIDTTVFTNAGAAIAKATVDAKGDLIAGTADNTVARLAVGANDTVLTADSSAATGLKWAAPVSTAGLTLIQNTPFSAVASQSINSVFSSTYDNYRVVFSATAASALTMTIRLRASGSDDSGSNYTLQDLFANGSSVTAARVSSQSSWSAVVVRTALLTPMVFDIFNPFTASPTVAFAYTVDIGDPAMRQNLMIQNQNTSYDGFNMICSTSNMTGAVSIYGYNK